MCALFSKVQPDKPREPFLFSLYEPVLQTDRLIPGIDNIRFDVSLSSKFMQTCRTQILQLIVKHSEAAKLLSKVPAPLKPADAKEFRRQLQEMLINALTHANVEKNPQLALLAEAAVFKYLAGELQAQYGTVVVQGREKLKVLQAPSQFQASRSYQVQEVFGNFQKNKKVILRKAAEELLLWMRDVRGDAVRKTRESFFGSESSKPHEVFSTPLIFTEDGKDDYLFLEHFVMLGNFQRDPDQFELVNRQVRSFLEWGDAHAEEAQQFRCEQEACEEIHAQLERLRKQQEEMASARRFLSRGGGGSLSPEELAEKILSLETELQQRMETYREASATYERRLENILTAPENAELLVDCFQTEQQAEAARGRNQEAGEILVLQQQAERQREALEKLYEPFSRAGLIPYILAAYETARIYAHFCPPINPQQLKVALVDGGERKKVAHLIREYGLANAPLEMLEEAARRVRDCGARESRVVLARFLHDFMRCYQDLRHFQLAQNLMERIHLPIDVKQRELSQINHTLYQFLMPEEEKPVEERVSSHVIMKADIRDSTSITAQLFARGLNPASYFSLNFFDPTRKLLGRYGASKVFLEGDALILSILEREGDTRGANSVARACCLARDMLEVVRAVNDRAMQNQLPVIELGVGICYQPAAPMYLMDGETPIMISKALNESDRLSGCGKLAKQVVGQKNRFFSVFVSQLLPDLDSKGSSEEFLLRYNVHGIEINELAFEKLCREIAMSRLELKLPLLGEPELVELYCGSLPLGPDSFQKIIIRRGRVPQLHPKDFRVVEYTDRHYYEVCCAKPVYEYVGRQLGWQMAEGDRSQKK